MWLFLALFFVTLQIVVGWQYAVLYGKFDEAGQWHCAKLRCFFERYPIEQEQIQGQQPCGMFGRIAWHQLGDKIGGKCYIDRCHNTKRAYLMTVVT